MAENINIPSGPNNLRNAILDMLATKSIDMKMRRVVDAAPAKDPNDYVILQQLTDVQNTLQQNIDKIKIPTAGGSVVENNSLLYVTPSANLNLTNIPTNVPGLTLTLNRTGIWLIIATIGFQHSGNENNAVFVGQLNVDGGAIGPGLYFLTPAGGGLLITQSGGTMATQYMYNATTQPHTVTVQCYKTTGSGTSIVGQSALSALWVRD